MLIFYPWYIFPWLRELSTCWVFMNSLYYLGSESGQHFLIRWILYSSLDSRVANMVTSDPCFLLPWIREWSICRESMETFYDVVFESGQYVEIQLICHFMLDSRVVNMLKFYSCLLLPCIRVWSTCWDVMNTFYCFGLESGQHVEVQGICHFMWDSRVVNMLKFYPCLLLPRIREWSTCWDANGYVLLFWTWGWWTCWDSMNRFF